MAHMVFKEGTIIFAGSFPEHVEEAKAYAKKNGFTKDDVKIYKEKYNSNGVEWEQVLIKTLRPIGMDCGVVDCPNHSKKET